MPSRSFSRSPKRRQRSSSRSKLSRAEAEWSSSESLPETKSKKKKKHKEHKKHKKNSSDDKSNKRKKHSKEEEALKFLQAANKPAAEAKVDNPISHDDYFRKATEFRVWLQRQGRYLEQLSAEKARSKFNKFVLVWNQGNLTPDFYKGMDSTAVTEKLSKHKWKFKNITSDEAAKRETTRDTVDTFTKAKGGENLDQLGPIAFRLAAQAKAASLSMSVGPIGPTIGPIGPAGPPEKRERSRQSAVPASNDVPKLREASDEGYARKPYVDRRVEEQNLRGNDARAKEDARMAAFRASMAPFLNFEQK